MPGTWPTSATSRSSPPSICPSIDPQSTPSFTSSPPSPPTRSTRSSPSSIFSPAISSKPQPEIPLSGLISDRGPRLGHDIVGLEVYLLVLDGTPEPLHKHIVTPCASAVHADGNGVVGQQAGEHERAKILERSRRGKRHAAHAGSVSVLSAAPYGYRYVDRH